MLDMILYTILTCTGSLILTFSRPVACANDWTIDPASCGDQSHFVSMQMLRATTIAKNAALWLPEHPRMNLKPNFANALLGSNYASTARTVFKGGSVRWRGGDNVIGLSGLGNEVPWGGVQAGNVVQSPITWRAAKALALQSSSFKMLIHHEVHLLQRCQSGAIKYSIVDREPRYTPLTLYSDIRVTIDQ